jgi:hypothetical protein
MTARVLVLAAVLASPALPRDREFDGLVQSIETRYQVCTQRSRLWAWPTRCCSLRGRRAPAG